jgi:hypothetical protein
MAIVHSRMAAAWFALGVFVLSGIVSTAAPAECSGARGARPAHVGPPVADGRFLAVRGGHLCDRPCKLHRTQSVTRFTDHFRLPKMISSSARKMA